MENRQENRIGMLDLKITHLFIEIRQICIAYVHVPPLLKSVCQINLPYVHSRSGNKNE